MSNNEPKPNPSRSLVRAIRASIERRPRKLTPGGSRVWLDKKLIELDVVQDLVRGLRVRGDRRLTDVQPREETRPPTPPDVLARNETDGLVGIEVCELTDQEVVELNIPRARARFAAMERAASHEDRVKAHTGHPLKVRLWSGREVLDKVAAILGDKDAKSFAVEDEAYAERWLAIHTAEPYVDWVDFEIELSRRRFTPVQFDRVYLIRGYDPLTRSYPWSQVHPAPQ